MHKCFIGYAEEFNHTGRCCCNCRYQRPISGHPWNTNSAYKSRVSDTIGWGCTVPDMPKITFSEKEHGMCKMHQFRTEQLTDKDTL